MNTLPWIADRVRSCTVLFTVTIAGVMSGSCADLESAVSAAEPPELVSQQISATTANVKLEKVATDGEGCPARSLSAVLSPDGQMISLNFKSFAPSLSSAQQQRAMACRLAIGLKSAPGITFQVRRFIYRGYSYLESGVEADLSATVSFQADSSKSERITTTLRSPFDGDYIFDDRTRNDALWSPCEQNGAHTLNVLFEVLLRNGQPAADGTLELSETTDIELEWRKCNPRSP